MAEVATMASGSRESIHGERGAEPARVEGSGACATESLPTASGSSRRGRRAVALLCAALVVFAWYVYQNRSNPYFRESGVQCLGAIGTPAAPLLVRVIGGEDDRRVSAVAIAELLGMKAAASRALVAALLDEDDSARRNRLIHALDFIECSEADAGPVLEAMSVSDPRSRLLAVRTLPFVSQRTTAIPALIPALEDPDASVRVEAAGSLALYGPAAAAAIPSLESLTKTADAEARQKATDALDVIRGKGRRGVDVGD